MSVTWNAAEQATFTPESIVFTVIADGKQIIAVDANGQKLASVDVGDDDSQAGGEILRLAQLVASVFDEAF